jgi:hypothetical protein
LTLTVPTLPRMTLVEILACTGRSIEGPQRSAAGSRVAPTGRGPLGLCALTWRVAAHFCGPALRQKQPICRYFLRWRDPDSNGGHHDFQGLAAGDAWSGKSWKSGGLSSRRAGPMPADQRCFVRRWDFVRPAKSQSAAVRCRSSLARRSGIPSMLRPRTRKCAPKGQRVSVRQRRNVRVDPGIPAGGG